MERGAFRLFRVVGLGLSLTLALPGCGGGTGDGLTSGPAANSDASDLFASLARVVIPRGSQLFLKLAGIEGDSVADGHKGEIDVLSWSWGVQNASAPNSGAGAGASRPVFSDIVITKEVDKASPKLFEAVAKGQHLPDGVFAVRKAGGKQEEFYKIELKDVLISSFSQHVDPSGSDDVPTESFSLNFSKVTITYWPQKPDGSLEAPVSASYDVKTGRYH